MLYQKKKKKTFKRLSEAIIEKIDVSKSLCFMFVDGSSIKIIISWDEHYLWVLSAWGLKLKWIEIEDLKPFFTLSCLSFGSISVLDTARWNTYKNRQVYRREIEEEREKERKPSKVTSI